MIKSVIAWKTVTIPDMATVEMACVVPGCDMGNGAPYKTEMVEAGIAWNMLQLHINHAHTAVAQADPAAQEARPQAECVKRPGGRSCTGSCRSQASLSRHSYPI